MKLKKGQSLIHDDVYPSRNPIGLEIGYQGFAYTNNVPNRDRQIIRRALDEELVFIGNLEAGCNTKDMR